MATNDSQLSTWAALQIWGSNRIQWKCHDTDRKQILGLNRDIIILLVIMILVIMLLVIMISGYHRPEYSVVRKADRELDNLSNEFPASHYRRNSQRVYDTGGSA